MAKIDIRKFRHDIAVLKRKGLIEGVDARSVKPTSKFKRLVNRFDDVLSGKTTPVKLSPSETKNLKAAGYDVYKGRTMFPHAVGEKVGVSHGHAKVRQPSGVEIVTLPVPYHDLESYLRNLKRQDKTIDKMKKRDEYFAFRFYGHQSHAIYRNIDLLLDDLKRYEAIEDAKRSKNAKSMNEVYRNLEIVKVHRSRDWAESAEARRKERGDYDANAYQRAKAKREAGPEWKQNEYNERQAAKQRDRRERIKKDPAKYAKYKAAAKKRAKKSRRKNAKKNRRT